MASVRMAAGSLLDTVSNTAQTVSAIVNTVSGGAEYLNNAVQHMKDKQRITQVVEMVNFEESVIKTGALENVRLEETVRQYIGNDEIKQESYNKYDTKLREAISNLRKPNTEE